MKPFLLFCIFSLLLFSCKNDKSIAGVWHCAVTTEYGEEYLEAHINDTSYLVISNNGIKYSALYEIDQDTLLHYIQDLSSYDTLSYAIIDTAKFKFDIKNNTLKLTNIKNPEVGSSWTFIKNAKPIAFQDAQMDSENWKNFTPTFKQRYKENFVDTMANKIDASFRLLQYDMVWEN